MERERKASHSWAQRSFAASLASIGLLFAPVALLGCDPDLTIAKSDAAAADASTSVNEAGSTSDATTEDASLDAGVSDGAADEGTTSDSSVQDSGLRTITSAADFTMGERFVSSSGGANVYTGFVAWDRTRIYFGMQGPDVRANNARYWVQVYLAVPGADGGTAQGSTSGLAYGTQQPNLPFAATHHLRWKGDRSYTNSQSWSGSAWVDATVSLPLLSAGSDDFLVLSVSRAALGMPTSLKVHINMLIEESGNDWSYAAVPSTSFMDGADRDYGKYFEFDLTSSQAPNTFPAKP